MKERLPDVIVIGVDPIGSILAEPDSLNDYRRLQSYKVEGTGYDFIPNVLDRELVDMWIKTSDHDSLNMSRRMIREEGLLCGGSCGASMWAAIEAAKIYNLGSDKRVVVILPDSTRNYMTKFLVDDWMVKNGFMEDPRRSMLSSTWWAGKTVADLKPSTPVTCGPDFTCTQAIGVLKEQGFDQLPVVDSGNVLGVVTSGNLAAKLLSGRVQGDDPVVNAVYNKFLTVSIDTPLVDLANKFDEDHFALVMTTQTCYTGAGPTTTSIVAGVVSRIDLMNYIAAGQDQ